MVMKRRLRIIVHGGMHKTGTKSLQHLLAENRRRLADEGIYYPPSPEVNHAPYVSVKEKAWEPGICLRLLQEAERGRYDTVIMSCESVSTFSAEQFQKLHACFAGHHVKYVFCFRHWSGFFPSRWAQNARRDTQTFEAYTRAVTSPGSRHIDYRHDLVLAYAERCGDSDIAAVSHDNAVAEAGSVIPRLLQVLELPQHLISAFISQEIKLNRRAEWAGIELCRLFNGILSDRWQLAQDERYWSLAEHRACDSYFDVAPKIAALDPATLNSLSEIVARHSIRRAAAVADTEFVAKALADTHGRRFTNLI